MAKMHVKKGDTVVVIAGKDKGLQGEILSANPSSQRVAVRGAAVVKKHLRPTQQNPNGGIEEREAPIHVSNVMLVCPSCGLPTRTASKREAGKKVRVCKKCGKDID